MSQTLKIGILTLHGAFAEHIQCLEKAIADLTSEGKGSTSSVTMETIKVRHPDDVVNLDGLIIPGGESTTMSKFMERTNIKEAICAWIKGGEGGRPVVWGTCAGMILLANNVTDMKLGGQITLGGMDITVSRNAYGRQNESFEAPIRLESNVLRSEIMDLNNGTCPGVFIRAPGIVSVDSDSVEVLAYLDRQGVARPVAVQQDNMIATSFHPELTDDTRWHKYFLKQVIAAKAS